MPADHGLRPDDLQSVQHARCQPIQPGKYQTVDAGEALWLRRFTSQHVELMSKRQYLYLQRRSRPEQSDQRQPNQAANVSHQPRASPNSTPLASRIEFSTMTTLEIIARMLAGFWGEGTAPISLDFVPLSGRADRRRRPIHHRLLSCSPPRHRQLRSLIRKPITPPSFPCTPIRSPTPVPTR